MEDEQPGHINTHILLVPQLTR